MYMAGIVVRSENNMKINFEDGITLIHGGTQKVAQKALFFGLSFCLILHI